MKFRSQTLFPLGILTLLVALTFWLEQATRIGEAGDDARKRHDPDYVVDNFNVRRFGPEGGLQNVLTARRMVHFPDDDTTLVDEPRLSLLGPRTTHVTAGRGLVGTDGTEIALVGDVRVTRLAGLDEPELVFTTSTLTVLPDEEVVRTAAPVTIIQGASVVHGVGLEADNKTAIYRLLNRVTATIESRRP